MHHPLVLSAARAGAQARRPAAPPPRRPAAPAAPPPRRQGAAPALPRGGCGPADTRAAARRSRLGVAERFELFVLGREVPPGPAAFMNTFDSLLRC